MEKKTSLEAPTNELNKETMKIVNGEKTVATQVETATRNVAIGEDEIKKATEKLRKFISGKRNLDERVKANEEWWKLRHWNLLRKGERKDVEPTSAWLFNSIMNKLADYSDNIPEPNIRARMQDDVKEAERLKNLLPMIFEANDFEATYMDTCLSKIKNGTSITGIFWNTEKENGLGDVDIKPIDILSIYWQPGIKDIQKSSDVFVIDIVDNEILEKAFPDKNITTGDNVTSVKYLYEDDVDTSDKTAVIDWYYKKDGKLHFCKFCNSVVLAASENQPDKYPQGWYDDGQYPFVVDTLFKLEGTIAGFGYLDVCKSPQEYIDKLDQAILTNTLMTAQPRYFERNDSSVNREEFLDWNNPLVSTNGGLGEEDLRKIDTPQISSNIFNAREAKVQELKQTSGNSDVSTGTAGSGVTAASAIAQLIETGSKGSRHTIKGTYRAFRKTTYLIIERIRQFYDMPRYVRILAEDGTETFETYDNSGLKLQTRQGIDSHTVNRLPVFDIEVTAQKASPYNKLSQNELALQFYQYGFFAPQNTDATLACLKMMDFDHKNDIIQMVQKNGTLLDALEMMKQTMAQMAQENEKLKVLCDLYVPGSNLSGNISSEKPLTDNKKDVNANIHTGNMPTPEETRQALGDTTNSLSQGDGTNSKAEQMRKRAADSTEV